MEKKLVALLGPERFGILGEEQARVMEGKDVLLIAQDGKPYAMPLPETQGKRKRFDWYGEFPLLSHEEIRVIGAEYVPESLNNTSEVKLVFEDFDYAEIYRNQQEATS